MKTTGNSPKSKARRMSDRQARHLIDPEVKLAKRLLRVSHDYQELAVRLLELIHDHEDAAAFKARLEQARRKAESSSPGDPWVAGELIKLEKQMDRINARRRKNLERYKVDVERVIGEFDFALAKHEGRA